MEEYLGDSVYAKWNGWAIVLTTRNGLPTDPSNEIVLDGDTMGCLMRFVDRVKETIAAKEEGR